MMLWLPIESDEFMVVIASTKFWFESFGIETANSEIGINKSIL